MNYISIIVPSLVILFAPFGDLYSQRRSLAFCLLGNLRCPTPRRLPLTVSSAAASHNLHGRPIGGALEPFGDHALVRIGKALEKTAGGVLIPEAHRPSQALGQVVSLGKTSKAKPEVKQGDWVLFEAHSANTFDYDEEKHGIIPFESLLAVARNEMYPPTPSMIRPLGDFVLIEETKKPGLTSGGLLVPQEGEESPAGSSVEGKVIAASKVPIGKGTNNTEETVKEGEYVRTAYSDRDNGFTFQDRRYIFVSLRDIVAKWI